MQHYFEQGVVHNDMARSAGAGAVRLSANYMSTSSSSWKRNNNRTAAQVHRICLRFKD